MMARFSTSRPLGTSRRRPSAEFLARIRKVPIKRGLIPPIYIEDMHRTASIVTGAVSDESRAICIDFRSPALLPACLRPSIDPTVGIGGSGSGRAIPYRPCTWHPNGGMRPRICHRQPFSDRPRRGRLYTMERHQKTGCAVAGIPSM